MAAAVITTTGITIGIPGAASTCFLTSGFRPWVIYREPRYVVLADEVVADVQAALNRNGYDAGLVDGVMGPRTRNAIAAYQSDHGLSVTGTITDALLRRLGL